MKELNTIKKTIPNISDTCDNKFVFSDLDIGYTQNNNGQYNYCIRGTMYDSHASIHDLDWYCEYQLPISLKGLSRQLIYKMRKKESIRDIAR